jgi:FtsZ-interacting cell division protein YlmF
MRLSSVTKTLKTMLKKTVAIRAKYMRSKSRGDVVGMRKALEMSLAIDQDIIAILSDPKTMAEIRKSMRELKAGKGIPWEKAKKRLGLEN